MGRVGLLGALLLFAGATASEFRHAGTWRTGCVVGGDRREFRFDQRDCEGWAAHASYIPGQHTASGWGRLRVTTSQAWAGRPEDAAFAAGFAEGFLTAPEVALHHANTVVGYLGVEGEVGRQAAAWLLRQDEWAAARVQAERAGSGGSARWRAVGLLRAQLAGMAAGYEAARVEDGAGELEGGGRGLDKATSSGVADSLPPLSYSDFLLISAVGDLDEILEVVKSNSTGGGGEARADGVRPGSVIERRTTDAPGWHSADPGEVLASIASTGRCSALVRVTPDLSQLLLGHSSWFSFSAMVRIFKHFEWRLSDPSLPLRRASFSSYPGELSSDDDFYLLDTGLAVLQTTNPVRNRTLTVAEATPEALLSWQRVRVANHAASDGGSWASHLLADNSGTGNNQWMVVDLKRFRPRRRLRPGILTVIEQIPGLVLSTDATPHLERGYWPSYNLPFHAELAERAGLDAAAEELERRGGEFIAAADALRYDTAPRARIFRRDAPKVHDVGSLKAFLRSDAYPNEDLGDRSAYGAICGRGDVDRLSKPRAYGCYDTKVASHEDALALFSEGVVGPTWTEDGRLEPFEWVGELAERTPHRGQRKVWNTTFERMDVDEAPGPPPDSDAPAPRWGQAVDA